MNSSLVKQSGHAGLLFALIAPALFALFILASDGARALQNKARLGDAAEATVLAISAQASAITSSQLAENYISHYMTDALSTTGVTPSCVDSLGDKICEVQVTTEHFSWFPVDDGSTGFSAIGFGEKFSVTSSASAIKKKGKEFGYLY